MKLARPDEVAFDREALSEQRAAMEHCAVVQSTCSKMTSSITAVNTMRLRSFLVIALAFALPCWAWAQQSDASKKSILFLESVAIPKKAKVCAARIEGFGTKFEPAYERWHKAHQAELAEGEALLRAEAEKTFTSFEQNVQAITSLPAQMLGKTSQAVLEENCNAMLTKLGAASDIVVAPSPGGSRPDPGH